MGLRRDDSLPTAKTRDVTNVLLGANKTRRVAIARSVKEDMATFWKGIAGPECGSEALSGLQLKLKMTSKARRPGEMAL